MLGLHHAYICNYNLSKEDCQDLFLSSSVSEIDFIESVSFGVGEARGLIKKAYTKPLVGKKKAIVVKVKSFTVEAENALLKILEEPPATTIFFFVIPKEYQLIPTLRSRFIIYDDVANEIGKDAEILLKDSKFTEFLKFHYKDRLKIVSDNLAKSDNDWVLTIRNGLIVKMSEFKKQLTPNTLKRINMILSNLNTRGASNKMLLEELALTLPENI